MKLISSVALALFAVVLVPAVQAQAPNDGCATAIAIGDGVFAGSNALATSGPDPLGSCGAMGNDVWYAYTASCTGIAIAEFCNAGNATYDTVLTAWSGSCGTLLELSCNDDWCGLSSHITFGVTTGVVYYISVGGFGGSTGNFNLSVSCLVPAGNDVCSGALSLPEAVVTNGTNVGTTTGPDPVVTNCGFANSSDVWYVLVPSCSGTYTATTCLAGTNFDTVLGIWDGTGGCGNLIALACNDDDPTFCQSGQAFGLESRVSWTATAGTSYYISLAGYAGNTGNFQLIAQLGSGMALTFTNNGVGTIGYQVVGAPPNGACFTGITLQAGAYPTGWFFGIDIGFAELSSEINTGFPFLTGLTACGSTTVGPFAGVPSGLTLYGVALGFPFGASFPSVISPPATATVP